VLLAHLDLLVSLVHQVLQALVLQVLLVHQALDLLVHLVHQAQDLLVHLVLLVRDLLDLRGLPVLQDLGFLLVVIADKFLQKAVIMIMKHNG